MSRTLARLARITIPFTGSEQQRKINQASHVWRVISLEERYGTRGLPVATECQRCKVVADAAAADWPCGAAPSPLTVDEYTYIFNKYNSHS